MIKRQKGKHVEGTEEMEEMDGKVKSSKKSNKQITISFTVILL